MRVGNPDTQVYWRGKERSAFILLYRQQLSGLHRTPCIIVLRGTYYPVITVLHKVICMYQPQIFIGDVTKRDMIHLVGSYEYSIPTEPILPCVDSMIVSRYPLHLKDKTPRGSLNSTDAP